MIFFSVDELKLKQASYNYSQELLVDDLLSIEPVKKRVRRFTFQMLQYSRRNFSPSAILEHLNSKSPDPFYAKSIANNNKAFAIFKQLLASKHYYSCPAQAAASSDSLETKETENFIMEFRSSSIDEDIVFVIIKLKNTIKPCKHLSVLREPVSDKKKQLINISVEFSSKNVAQLICPKDSELLALLTAPDSVISLY